MKLEIILITAVSMQCANASAGEGNRAYLEARKRPAFNIHNPAGLTTDKSEKARQRETGAALHARIVEAWNSGAKEYRIPPGEYRLAGKRRLLFEDIEDLTINAAGVTFWFERDIKDAAVDPPGLEFARCKGVALKGASIDFDPRKSKPLANIDIADNTIKSGPLGFNVGSDCYGKSLRSAIYVTVSDDVDVRNNTVVDPKGYCTDGLVDVGAMAERITVE